MSPTPHELLITVIAFCIAYVVLHAVIDRMDK